MRQLSRVSPSSRASQPLIGIDPFDQPDVEAAKVLARDLTDRYDKTATLADQKPSFDDAGLALYTDTTNHAELTRAVGDGGDLAAYLGAHLERAGSGDYVALLAYVAMTPTHEAILTEIRALISVRIAATCKS